MKHAQWLQSLNDRELIGLYLTHCSQSETPCDKINILAEAIWLETFDRGLI